MKFGVCLTHYGREIRSSELVEAVAEIERLGFDSIRVTDHVVIPQGVREAQLIYRERMLEAFVHGVQLSRGGLQACAAWQQHCRVCVSKPDSHG